MPTFSAEFSDYERSIERYNQKYRNAPHYAIVHDTRLSPAKQQHPNNAPKVEKNILSQLTNLLAKVKNEVDHPPLLPGFPGASRDSNSDEPEIKPEQISNESHKKSEKISNQSNSSDSTKRQLEFACLSQSRRKKPRWA